MRKKEQEAMKKDKLIQKGRDLRTAKTILAIVLGTLVLVLGILIGSRESVDDNDFEYHATPTPEVSPIANPDNSTGIFWGNTPIFLNGFDIIWIGFVFVSLLIGYKIGKQMLWGRI